MDRIDHLEQRVNSLADRLNTAEKGDYSNSPFALTLIKRLEAVEADTQTLMDERTEKSGVEKFMTSWKGKLTWVVGVAGGLLAIVRFFIIDPPF